MFDVIDDHAEADREEHDHHDVAGQTVVVGKVPDGGDTLANATQRLARLLHRSGDNPRHGWCCRLLLICRRICCGLAETE